MNKEEIKSGLISNIDSILFETIADDIYWNLSPRSREINTMIRTIKKSI